MGWDYRETRRLALLVLFFFRFHLRSCIPCNQYSMDKGLEHILRLKAIHYPCDETEDTLTAPPTHLMLKSPALQSLTLQSNGQIDPLSRLWGDWLQTELLLTNHKFHKVSWETIHTVGVWVQVLQKEQSSSKVHRVLFSQVGAPGSRPDRSLFLCKSGHSHLCCFPSHHTLQETPASTLLPETRINCYLPSKLSLTSTTRISPSPLLPKNSPLFLLAQSLKALVMTNQTLSGLFYNYIYTYLNLLLNYCVCVCVLYTQECMGTPACAQDREGHHLIYFHKAAHPLGLTDWPVNSQDLCSLLPTGVRGTQPCMPFFLKRVPET